jgi:hypothetical protein
MVDVGILKKLEKAASLYGIKDTLDKMTPKFTQMTKQASEEEVLGMVKAAEAMYEGDLAGFLNIGKAVETAEALWVKYAGLISSEEVKRYTGHAYLNKEAAIQALSNRYLATGEKNPTFIKIANLITAHVQENDYKSISDICKAVTLLDKQAGLDLRGFNFWKEALITKEASFTKGLTVRLNNKDVPYTKVASLGKNSISSYLGKEACAGLNGDPVNDKYLLEALPRDLQITLAQVLKGV